MFRIVAFLFIGLTFAGFPSDDYVDDYEEVGGSLARYTTQDPTASEALLRRIRGNIKKLFAGRELPSELTDPTKAVSAEDATALEAVAATEETASSEHAEYLLRMKIQEPSDSAEYDSNDETGLRFNYAGLQLRQNPVNSTNTTSNVTSTSTCRDDEGYPIRCPKPTTTTPLPTAEEEMIQDGDNETVIAEKKQRYSNKVKKHYDSIKLSSEAASREFIKTSESVDIDKLLYHLTNLTYIYETDLVAKMKKSLNETGYPYCPSTFSTTIATTTPILEVFDNKTGIISNKCFVCGLEAKGVPNNARCADAFASDFFPTAPVDFTARASMERYKKHCKYIDKPSWFFNGSRDRLMWGRWTGGCSVRWIDLSGIYTQRACRNRNRPVLGHHYGSKRMAKLEYALNKEENGCIISPQASLVPFSRGISLFARFHACVCTGNYCNSAERHSPLKLLPMLVYVMAARECFY